ncbi:class I SAM-dependent methyltransferase [Marinilabilia rubra]|uniref:Methyltransferase domain-containing protein n=1 Tax=Marinilabilia rubra TaxID=2162893 RepID=A0A2U2B4N3_9BACT|nr:class I SAM-dependent methyltransferase [Marinilabilia rubra]PWD98030.1 hypothetical protein DDZ16_17700 [Marinilabilia rubra]
MFYQSIAEYYDFIFPPSEKQRAFIEQELSGLERKTLLEAGCGTGNLASLLSEKGADVTGIDLDKEMILKAKTKVPANGRITFENLNILEIDQRWAKETFDGVVSFGNTLVHLKDKKQVLQFLKGCFMVLKPGGKLLVQIINYDRILDNEINALPTIDNEKISFERFYDYGPGDNHIDFRTILTVKESNTVMRNVVSLLPVRQKDLKCLFEETGFEKMRVFGGFGGNGLTSDSIPLVFSAMKPV